MSSGSSNYDDVPPAGSLEKWKRITRADPRVMAYYTRMLRTTISHRYDMPYVAGYSRDGKRIFIDKDAPFLMDIDGAMVCVRDFIKIHEAAEKSLLTYYDPKYEPCHDIATAVEYDAVRKSGVDVNKYRKALRPVIKHEAADKFVRIPYDLDLTPMKDEPTLLSIIRPLMAEDRKTARHIFRKQEQDQ